MTQEQVRDDDGGQRCQSMSKRSYRKANRLGLWWVGFWLSLFAAMQLHHLLGLQGGYLKLIRHASSAHPTPL